MQSPIEITLLVIQALEKSGASYLIGGSLASTVHGIARATMDADLVSDIGLKQVSEFTKTLGKEFYADASAICEALLTEQSFNVIHLDSMFKVDVFPLGRHRYNSEQFQRRERKIVLKNPDQSAYIATPEDTILSKLIWYRKGGDVSDRQWRDVLGVLKVQADRLDFDYMDLWAGELKITDLLQKAYEETNIRRSTKKGQGGAAH